jgi:hypothetical protein
MAKRPQNDSFASRQEAEKRCAEQRQLPNVESCTVSKSGPPWIAATKYKLRIRQAPAAGKK